MKQLLFTLLLSFFSTVSYSQGETISFKSSLDLKTTKNGADSLKLLPGTLNNIFKDQLNSVAFKAEDLSLQRYYANLTNEDNAFSFGLNFNNLRKKEDKASWILSLGLGAKSTNDFATIYKNSEVQNEINGSVKLTLLGRGIIYTDIKQSIKSKKYFDDYLVNKYEKKFAYYIKQEGDIDDDITKAKALNQFIYSTTRDSLMDTYRIKLKNELIEEEAKSLLENKLYKKIWDHWLTFEAKLPLTIKSYNISDTVSNPNSYKKGFYNWNFSLKYTNMWKWSKGSSLYLSGRVKIYYDNNIETENLTSADFLSFVNQSSAQSATTETNKVYIGRYNEFATAGFSTEVIFFPRNKYVGVSACIEQMISATNYLNWKMGIPISLKDKEGKPLVSLELQWKEINHDHFIGINVGFVLGKFVG